MINNVALGLIDKIGLGKIIVGVLALAAVGGLGYMFMDSRAKVREYSLRADSLQAVADTTRLVSANTWERRAIQAELERDDLDRELEQVRMSTVETTVLIDTVYVETEADTTETLADGTRYALFETYRKPLSAKLQVWLPEPPGAARLSMTTALDPIPLTVDVTCSESVYDSSVRRAMFRANGPEWADIRMNTGTVEPTVCLAPALNADVSFSFGRNVADPVIVGAVQGAAIVALMDARLEGSAGVEDYLLGAGTSAAISFLRNLLPW